YRSVIESRSDAKRSPLPIDFDRFLFWGDMLLADFNDVDMYLADAAQLFKNVKNYKEIGSNYLTPEQMDIIRRYWGEDAFKSGSTIDLDNADDGVEHGFWKHVAGCGDDYVPAHKFVKLWEIMMELYVGFKADLQRDGIVYPGMAYRLAAKMLKSPENLQLPYKRYVFVGFNVLSVSELAIFERLKAVGKADFYWDFNSPALRHPGNRAATFLRNYLREFKPIYDIGEDDISGVPRIRIVGVPSNVGQAKAAGDALSHMLDDGAITDVGNAIDTAIVLPDEEMLIPVLSSIPAKVSSINVTMGFPLRHTPVASLIQKIVSMQLRARKVHGEYEFFRDDVMNVIAHPIIRAAIGDGGQALVDYMASNRLFNLPASVVRERFAELLPILTPVPADSADAHIVFEYVSNLFGYLASRVSNPLDVKYLELCMDSVTELDESTQRFDIHMSRGTFFHLMERALQSQTVSFNGEPL
ncbi:MAG: hypothetical protein K2M76_03490, partial [Muribaculaceae bacterium]|nr:hypothetical protein [Muribaculaceae bacterium]